MEARFYSKKSQSVGPIFVGLQGSKIKYSGLSTVRILNYKGSRS